MHPLRLGTRGSQLALWQAHYVADRLRPLVAPRPVELVLIHTHGDRVLDQPLNLIGGDGLFTKEIQRAVLDHTADVAVHSLKDLPTAPVPGLVLAAVPSRGPTGDAFVSQRWRRCADLPAGATVATSSLRRRAQLLHYRPDLRLVDMRGNVHSRLRKLVDQGLDGLILAQAGLERLGLHESIAEVLDPAWLLPAVGQGALGLECRADDLTTRTALAALDDPATHAAVLAERTLLAALGGGCLVPLGALGRHDGTTLRLRAAVLDCAGQQRVADELTGSEPIALGQALAERLRAAGAEQLLRYDPAALNNLRR
jgi:hydroxymethylbilane synthase